MSNLPFSEQFRLCAKDWAEKESCASLLEESKSAVLAQRMAVYGDVAVNKAERDVKSSPEWMDYIERMVTARGAANLAKVKLEFIRMKHWENQGAEASKRAEMRL